MQLYLFGTCTQSARSKSVYGATTKNPTGAICGSVSGAVNISILWVPGTLNSPAAFGTSDK